MTEQRHPDIEIYVKNRSIADIENWLGNCAERLEQTFSQGTIHEYSATIGEHRVPVMIHEKVAGKAWVSIWFKSENTPWAKDIDCAQAAADAMDTQVRFIASGWSDGDDPDEWWKIENGNVEKIQWRT